MNLAKLFETQRVLRDRIGYNGEDRFEKLILALLVEIGECANEWRGFKFWSKDQKPRTFGVKGVGHGIGTYNPLLEEYVDGLHFVLEIGLELDYIPEDWILFKEVNVNDSFLTVMEIVIQLDMERSVDNYSVLFKRYTELGEMLGFTWEEIESAYYAKNQINHERQSNGY